MSTARRNPIQAIIEDFAPRHVASSRVLLPGRKSERRALADFGVAPVGDVAMPDVVIHDLDHDWLFLIDASPQRRHMTEARACALKKHFDPSRRHLILFTAFPDPRSFSRCVESIAWGTHVWIADAPDHMIHFNGERFLGPYT